MKRTAPRILLFLLLGAAIDVAVAWACAIWSPFHIFSALSPVKEDPTEAAPFIPWPWPVHQSNGRPLLLYGVERSRGLGIVHDQMLVGPFPTPSDSAELFQTLHVHRSGWPLPALVCVVYAVPWMYPTSPGFTPPDWQAGVPVPKWLRPNQSGFPQPRPMDRAIPWAPLAVGFGLNSLFYAAICWGFLWFPSRIITFRRRRRHLCLHCAYPIGISPVCTECGHPLEPRSGALQ